MSVTLERVSKTVGRETHIADVSIAFERGTLNVLLGLTLSGKTSLMRLLAGLDAPSAVRVRVDGRDMTGVHVRNRSVAMVYQQFINYPTLSVYENIASPLRVPGKLKAEIETRVRAAADMLRLGSMLERTPLQLSGGQQQRCAIKTVSLKKSHVGLTFTRESDIWDKSCTERAPKLGGLIEFYRSPARKQWTPTGNNVPDYPKLAQLWWQNIGDAASGAKTPQAAMDSLAAAQDSVLERLERSKVQGACGPKLNKKESAEFWFAKAEKDGTIAPQRKLANEKPKGETIDYDTLIKSWPATPPKK